MGTGEHMKVPQVARLSTVKLSGVHVVNVCVVLSGLVEQVAARRVLCGRHRKHVIEIVFA